MSDLYATQSPPPLYPPSLALSLACPPSEDLLLTRADRMQVEIWSGKWCDELGVILWCGGCYTAGTSVLYCEMHSRLRYFYATFVYEPPTISH